MALPEEVHVVEHYYFSFVESLKLWLGNTDVDFPKLLNKELTNHAVMLSGVLK